jgi:hypothetical protein
VLRILIALILVAHGVGHSMGLLAVFRVATVNPAWDGSSWLLTGPTGKMATQAVAVLLWTAAIVGFTALAAVVLGWLPSAWFTPLAVGSAVVSLVSLLLFPAAFPPFSTIGALVVDLAVLGAVGWYHWLPGDPV